MHFFLFSQRNLIKNQNFTFIFVKMEIHTGDLNSRYSTFPCATPKTQGTFSCHGATSYPINDTENTPLKASGARIPNKSLRGRDARREPVASAYHNPAASRCATPWPAEGARRRPGRAAAPGPHNLSKFGRRVRAPRSARLLASAPARLQPDLPAALFVRAGAEAPSQPPHRGWRAVAPFPLGSTAARSATPLLFTRTGRNFGADPPPVARGALRGAASCRRTSVAAGMSLRLEGGALGGALPRSRNPPALGGECTPGSAGAPGRSLPCDCVRQPPRPAQPRATAMPPPPLRLGSGLPAERSGARRARPGAGPGPERGGWARERRMVGGGGAGRLPRVRGEEGIGMGEQVGRRAGGSV